MVPPHSIERLKDDLNLEHFFKVHFSLSAVFIYMLIHVRHHGHIHFAVLGPPTVKGRAVDAKLNTKSEMPLTALSR